MGSHRRASSGKRCGRRGRLEDALDWGESKAGTMRRGGQSPSPQEEGEMGEWPWALAAGLGRGGQIGGTKGSRLEGLSVLGGLQVSARRWEPWGQVAGGEAGGCGGPCAAAGTCQASTGATQRCWDLGLWSGGGSGLGLWTSHTRDKSLNHTAAARSCGCARPSPFCAETTPSASSRKWL